MNKSDTLLIVALDNDATRKLQLLLIAYRDADAALRDAVISNNGLGFQVGRVQATREPLLAFLVEHIAQGVVMAEPASHE